MAVGNRVAPGQRLRLLGNSGNWSAPHLHIGLRDTPDPLTSESLPMGFGRYTLSGAPGPEARAALATPEATVSLTGSPRPQEARLPFRLQVADFGETGS